MAKRLRIGILGGGQLARMSAYQAYKLGFDVAVLEKEAHSPAGQLTKYEYVGWVNDKRIVKKFVRDCDRLNDSWLREWLFNEIKKDLYSL